MLTFCFIITGTSYIICEIPVHRQTHVIYTCILLASITCDYTDQRSTFFCGGDRLFYWYYMPIGITLYIQRYIYIYIFYITLTYVTLNMFIRSMAT